MPIRLIALDLDGTLLREDKTIAPRDAQAVRLAVTSGRSVVLCSARPPRGCRFVLDQLGLTGPMVCYNGALIVDASYPRPLRHVPMPFEMAMRLVQHARRQDATLRADVEMLDRWVTDRPDGTGVTATARIAPPDVIAPVEHWPREPVTKLMFAGLAERVAMLRGWIDTHEAGRVATVQTEPELLQVVSAGVNKGEALGWLCGRMGVMREEVMAVGDNENDIPMLRWAGLGVAMGHASEVIKRHADTTVAGNQAHGVAEAIELSMAAG